VDAATGPVAQAELVAFVATSDLGAARANEGVLGLVVAEENPYVVVFNAHGTVLRVNLVDAVDPAPFTVLGWTVRDIGATVGQLTGRGVTLERFEGMGQDPLGIWVTPDGGRVAWFKDPAGNLLSVSQP
jgi:DNA-binding beta-propeller fold protein YncE